MIAGLARRLRRKSPAAVVAAIRWRLERPWHFARVRGAPEYKSPTSQELANIEGELRALGIDAVDYVASPEGFREFSATAGFSRDYHGGLDAGVYLEKIFEHFVAWDLLGLKGEDRRKPYLDIASAASPWAKLLREKGIEAYSIDLEKSSQFADLTYYLEGDATAAPFTAASIGSASLQCAFEMFQGDADTRLIHELARILRPGGRVVISPLYMHTHPCFYQSPEHYGRGITDEGAARYVRRSANRVPSSRKYSAATLVARVWEPALAVGLHPRLHVLRNGSTIGEGIYLHFILVLDKPERQSHGVSHIL